MNNSPEPLETALFSARVERKPEVSPDAGWQWAVRGIVAYFLPFLFVLIVYFTLPRHAPRSSLLIFTLKNAPLYGAFVSTVLEGIALVLAIRNAERGDLAWALVITLGMLAIDMATIYSAFTGGPES